MSGRRRVSGLGLVSVLALGFGGTPARADSVADIPVISCDMDSLRICLRSIAPMIDSDGDGVSNADEIAAGTDPKNPLSTPGMPVLLGLARDGKLPSFQEGRSVLIVLPILMPDGSKIGFGDSRLFGRPQISAQMGWPQRWGGLKQLGIDTSVLGSEFGIDPNTGFSIGAPTLFGGGKKGKMPSGLEFALSKVSTAEVSAGSGDVLTPIPVLSGTRPGIAYPNAVEKQSGSRKDSTSTYTDTDGKIIGKSTERSNSAIDAKGNTATGIVKTWETTMPNGDKVKGNSATTQVTDNSGALLSTSKITTVVTEHPDGTTTEQTATVDTTENKDGSTTQTTTVETTQRDKNGNTTSTSTQTTTTVTQPDGTTKCSGSNCPAEKYVDPDAAVGTVSITPELMKKVVTKLNGNRTPVVDDGGKVQELPKGFLGDPNGLNPLILVDPDGAVEAVLVTPHFYNSPKGTENYGPPNGPVGVNGQPQPVPDDSLGRQGAAFVNGIVP